MKYPIDFVVLWVDDTDPEWINKKAKYTGTTPFEGNSDVRYRDWDTLKYWFRGVDKYAPWVRYVFFVTDNQKPVWLNVDHPKLKWVKHTDFIPKEYLPVFSCNPIELNLNKIKDLSENFVYFNDDVFLINNVMPEDFFVDGIPCDFPKLGYITPFDLWPYMLFNNVMLLNRHFSIRECIKKNWRKWIKGQSYKGLIRLLLYGRHEKLTGIDHAHIHTNFKKSTFNILWEKEYQELHNTSKNKLRTRNDVTQYCIKDWQIMEGNFHPLKPIGKCFSTAEIDHNKEILEYVRKQKGKVICLNDNEREQNFLKHKQMVIEAFEKILPQKSKFEL